MNKICISNLFWLIIYLFKKGAFMISICLKSKNLNSLNYIENYLDTETLPDIYYSCKKFKYYNNLIIHYKGTHKKQFYSTLSKILSNYFIDTYEIIFLKKQLSFDFFYFSKQEKKSIITKATSLLNSTDNTTKKHCIIENSLKIYFAENSFCNLDGFSTFRLYQYKKLMNEILESTINDYILQKEYAAYVGVLQEYISLQIPQTKCIHLLYGVNQKMLLDEYGNVIINPSNSQVYLSDISFSSNDYILNTLLSYLPKELFIHLECVEDNFISFLKLIYKDRFHICTDCKLCNEKREGK